MSKKIRARGLLLPLCLAALAAATLLPSGAGAGQRAKPAAVNPKTAAVREATGRAREISRLSLRHES